MLKVGIQKYSWHWGDLEPSGPLVPGSIGTMASLVEHFEPLRFSYLISHISYLILYKGSGKGEGGPIRSRLNPELMLTYRLLLTTYLLTYSLSYFLSFFLLTFCLLTTYYT